MLALSLVPRMELRPLPMLIARAELLALPAHALDALMASELAENPALDATDPPAEPLLRRAPIPGLSSPAADPVAAAADEPGELDRLRSDARATVPGGDHGVLEFLLGSLDERGLLTISTPEAAECLGVEPRRVERVLAALGEVGPPGMGARDFRQCLLKQLERVGDVEDAELVALARALVADHLEALADGSVSGIARAIGCSRDRVLGARDLIRQRLRPYPFAGAAAAPPPARAYAPDVLVVERSRAPHGLAIELAEERRRNLRVHPLYAELATDGGRARLEDRAWRHARHQAAQARQLIQRLEARRATLRRVSEYAVAHQHRFVRAGKGSPRALTQAKVAEAVGLHESTVSRAVSARLLQLPGGRVIPFRHLFTPSVGALDALRRLVASERRPLSDRELATALTAQGHPVARRTVAKYRAQLSILPAAAR